MSNEIAGAIFTVIELTKADCSCEAFYHCWRCKSVEAAEEDLLQELNKKIDARLNAILLEKGLCNDR